MVGTGTIQHNWGTLIPAQRNSQIGQGNLGTQIQLKQKPGKIHDTGCWDVPGEPQ